MFLSGSQLIGFGAASSGITPDEVANLYAWYRGDLGVTGSAPVTAWADQSGNSRNLDNTNGDPALASAAVNGHDAIDFDGNDSINDTTALSQALPIHVFLVIRPDAYTSGHRPFLLDEAGNTSHPLLNADGTRIAIYADGSSRAAPTGQPSAGSWGLLHWVQTAVVTKGAWNDDGYTSSGAISVSTGIGGISLGGLADSSAFMNCAIAECIIYTAELTGDNLTGIKDYINSRYALW